MTTHTRAHTMTRTRTLAGVTVVLGCLTLSACPDLQVPDYTPPSLQDLQDNPTPTKSAAAAQGLLVGTRAGMSVPNGYISLLGILGRESYNFDAGEPRFVTGRLG